jgi:type II secretory pathway component PulJ
MPTRSSHPVTPIGLRLRVRSANRARRAFSLIEILVVVTLLSVIIIGLVAMFSTTQKALLSSTTQVDLLETGRATMDMVGRDLEQMTPSYTNARNFSLVFSPYPLGYQTAPT